MANGIVQFLKKSFPYIKDSSKSFQKVSKESIIISNPSVLREKNKIGQGDIYSFKKGNKEEIINTLTENKSLEISGDEKKFISELIRIFSIQEIFDFITIFNLNALKYFLNFINLDNNKEIISFLGNIYDEYLGEIFKDIFLKLENDKGDNLLKEIFTNINITKKQKSIIVKILLFENDKLFGIKTEFNAFLITNTVFSLEEILCLFIDSINNHKDIGVFFSYFYFIYEKDIRVECLEHFLKVIESKDNDFYETKTILLEIKDLIENGDFELSDGYNIDSTLLLEYYSLLSTNPI